jgi:cell division cycle 20-like protein 1 (cofactor of APC complex)
LPASNRSCLPLPSFPPPPQVCGLRWSPDDRELASGGNDNQLFVWHQQSTQPVLRFSEHQAAVKAIAWSPHQHGLLVSGGGTADRCIRFWNTTTGQPLQCIDTGSQVCDGAGWVAGARGRGRVRVARRAPRAAAAALRPLPAPPLLPASHLLLLLPSCPSRPSTPRPQVCNLSWSKNVNELVSTHGYSQNQICVWRYPTMQKLATLTGHTMRVLYLAVSPDGQTIVTGECAAGGGVR